MNKTVSFFISLLVFLNFTFLAKAATDSSVTVDIVKIQQIDRCRNLKAGTLPLFIQSVTWQSSDRSVGLIKDKEENTPVKAQGRLEEIVKTSLENALTKCGFVLEPSPEKAIVLAVKIDDFFVKSVNEGLVGKTTGTVELTIDSSRPGTMMYSSSTHGFETDYKTGPSRKLKRLQKVLNQILIDVINEVAFSETFYKQIARMSQRLE